MTLPVPRMSVSEVAEGESFEVPLDGIYGKGALVYAYVWGAGISLEDLEASSYTNIGWQTSGLRDLRTDFGWNSLYGGSTGVASMPMYSIDYPILGTIALVQYGDIAKVRLTTRTDQLTEGTEKVYIQWANGRVLLTAPVEVSIRDTSKTPSYSISSVNPQISEGQSANFVISTENVSPGTTLAYSINGVDETDITSRMLTGFATIGMDGKANITIPIALDSFAEGTETLTVSVQNQSASLQIRDTVTQTARITFTNSVVLEGESAILNIVTTGYPSGTELRFAPQSDNAYNNFGTSELQARIDLSGGATLTGNWLLAKADRLTEGDKTETFKLVSAYDPISGNYLSIPENVLASILVRDVSTATSINFFAEINETERTTPEGNSAYFRVSTNFPLGTILNYDILEVSLGISVDDFGDTKLSGTLTTRQDGSAILYLPISSDNLTEGDEKFTLRVSETSKRFSPDVLTGSILVTIEDTSKTPIAPLYRVTAGTPSVDEGGLATFNLVTTNVSGGTSVSYTMTGISSSDIGGLSLTGSAVVDSSGRATISVPISADNFTEGAETLTLSIQGQSASVTINDTSKSALVPTYAISALSSSVSEGGIAQFSLATTNVSPGTGVRYLISGLNQSDINGGELTGSATVSANGSAQISIPIAADSLTEGTEVLMVSVGDQSATITVWDTSLSPSAGTTITNNSGIIAGGNVIINNNTVTNVNNGVIVNNTNSNNTTTTNTTTNNVNSGNTINTVMNTINKTIKVFDMSVTNDITNVITKIGDVTRIEGNQENNTVVGTDAVDRLFGGGGSDRFYASKGNDVLDGGDGTDAVTFKGKATDFRVEKVGGNWLVRDTRSDASVNQGENTLTSVERVAFEDKVLALDTDGVAGKAYRVYKAAFNRDPMAGDTAGLGFWIDKMDNAMDLIEVSARFVDSNEFRSLYGTNPTNEQFLTKLYTNVLGRQPEASGFNWWLNELNTNPTKTKAKVLADFAESAENQTGVVSIIGNGITYEPWVA